MSKKKKAVLAFSGGLDTSFAVKYLIHEKHLEVYTAIVNIGGFSADELLEIKGRAMNLGATSHVALEETNNYYEKIVKYLVYGNVLRDNTYPVSVSSERTHQAIALANYAKEVGADFLVHGSTGAGNDQIRFDMIFQILAPEIQILTPIRELQLSRKDEIEYLAKHGVEMDWKKAQYSINKGLWGTSIGGAETLSSHLPLPEDAFPNQLQATEPLQISLDFEKGEICGLNNQKLNALQAIQKLEALAGKFAIGRDMHIGNTIIGIKGRVGFEAAAAILIIKAHHALEKHTLSKWQLHWKEQLSNWYGMFVHESMYFEPVMRNIESFLESSQKMVSGKVFIELHPYRFVVQGIESEHDLMNADFGQYGETNTQWTAADAIGFTKIMANSLKIYKHVNGEL
jgi:argininosuccinate synthase